MMMMSSSLIEIRDQKPGPMDRFTGARKLKYVCRAGAKLVEGGGGKEPYQICKSHTMILGTGPQAQLSQN